MTAVTGCRAPRMDVIVGPMRRTALTPVKFEIIVDQSAKPRIISQLLPSGIMVRPPSNPIAHIKKYTALRIITHVVNLTTSILSARSCFIRI